MIAKLLYWLSFQNIIFFQHPVNKVRTRQLVKYLFPNLRNWIDAIGGCECKVVSWVQALVNLLKKSFLITDPVNTIVLNTRSYCPGGKVLSSAWMYSMLSVECISHAILSLSPSESTATTYPSGPTRSDSTFVR